MATKGTNELSVGSEKSPLGDSARSEFIVQVRNGLVLEFFLPAVSKLGQFEPGTPPMRTSSWLRVGSDNSITVTLGAADLAAGDLVGLAQVLADELAVDSSVVIAEQVGATLAKPAENDGRSDLNYSDQLSTSAKLRTVAAIAREILVSAAMNRTGDQQRSNYVVTRGVITHMPTLKDYTYGQVAADAALLPVPDLPTHSGSQMPCAESITSRSLDTPFPALVSAMIQHRQALGGTPESPKFISTSWPSRTASAPAPHSAEPPAKRNQINFRGRSYPVTRTAEPERSLREDAPYLSRSVPVGQNR